MATMIYHPKLGRWHTVPSERVAAVYRRSGWVDEPAGDPDVESDDVED